MIKNEIWLRKVLWVDTVLGCSTGLIGLFLIPWISHWFGISQGMILLISVITLCYGVVAFRLARHPQIDITLLRILIWANWIWCAISIILLFLLADNAKPLGKIFLILQIFVVSALAYLEGNQIDNQD
jgi:hypothetical protein